MKIHIIYTDPDMYWFEENYVHDLKPQYVNGYGLVKFEFIMQYHYLQDEETNLY